MTDLKDAPTALQMQWASWLWALVVISPWRWQQDGFVDTMTDWLDFTNSTPGTLRTLAGRLRSIACTLDQKAVDIAEALAEEKSF